MTRVLDYYEVNYWDNVARNVIPGAIPVNKFGRNPAVSTSTSEDVWDTGGLYVEPPTAEVVNLSSSSPNDDNTTPNTGARFVQVYGVSDGFALVNESVEMNGTGDVPTVNKYWFIHRLKTTEAGSTGSNVGTITAITTATGTATLATMLPTLNQTFMAMMMVPDGYYLRIKHWNSSIRLNAGGNGEYQLLIKPTGEVFQPSDVVGVATNAGTKPLMYEPFIQAPPRSIVKVNVIDVSAAVMVCSSSFHGALERIKTGFVPPSI